ncbi:MAG: CvpA family protein [Clostridia bacterium]|nr:CvpA family protein [Clostridia bacterium]
MSFVLDGIIILIFVIFIAAGVKKGFVKSALGIISTAAAIIIAINLYPFVAQILRDTVVYQNLTDNLNEKISGYIGKSIDEDNLSTLIDDAPDGFKLILKGFGTDVEDVKREFSEMVKNGEDNASEKIADYIVKPAAEMLSNAVAVILLFLVSLLVLNLIILLLDLIFKLPVLKTANKFLGGVAGFLVAILVSLIFCTAVNIALPYLAGAGVNIDPETAKGAFIFRLFTEINPLAFIYR